MGTTPAKRPTMGRAWSRLPGHQTTVVAVAAARRRPLPSRQSRTRRSRGSDQSGGRQRRRPSPVAARRRKALGCDARLKSPLDSMQVSPVSIGASVVFFFFLTQTLHTPPPHFPKPTPCLPLSSKPPVQGAANLGQARTRVPTRNCRRPTSRTDKFQPAIAHPRQSRWSRSSSQWRGAGPPLCRPSRRKWRPSPPRLHPRAPPGVWHLIANNALSTSPSITGTTFLYATPRPITCLPSPSFCLGAASQASDSPSLTFDAGISAGVHLQCVCFC